ncbi:hypothetical protein AB0H51_07490 [Streptomyces griseoluteus]|uniref:hypothetical protein n=1 Tax=Streptomyces griseoluteus TaxID=29306 RepID=UPI0034031520
MSFPTTSVNTRLAAIPAAAAPTMTDQRTRRLGPLRAGAGSAWGQVSAGKAEVGAVGGQVSAGKAEVGAVGGQVAVGEEESVGGQAAAGSAGGHEAVGGSACAEAWAGGQDE